MKNFSTLAWQEQRSTVCFICVFNLTRSHKSFKMWIKLTKKKDLLMLQQPDALRTQLFVA